MSKGVFLQMRTDKTSKDKLKLLVVLFNKKNNAKITITQLMNEGPERFVSENSHLLAGTSGNTEVNTTQK
jgi:hypothetical protein